MMVDSLSFRDVWFESYGAFVSVHNWLLDDALAYLDGGRRKFCEVVAA